jgi:IS30 family transposase
LPCTESTPDKTEAHKDDKADNGKDNKRSGTTMESWTNTRTAAECGLDAVCPGTIYHFIKKDQANGGNLHKNLRHKKYKQRTGSPDARGQICNRVSIEERPAIVDKKVRIGDWEADTVIGKGHKGVLVTLSERFSKLNLIAHLPSKHAEGVTEAIIAMLKPYKKELHTITFDNEKELSYHEKIA